ncbi:MarR family winged helix-turn-helix transcriptional regulator [Streptomyces hoynatensis]|uniref:MarR family transcriptional regulator n=1 Tax=Streptomyces hoynatensis TaxID=1141874 RepID=A0A3A9Z9N7_9ACTN|nr:MarR family winged helix-turn-helix transcriptional regulator [Streptomyces hoynatensis]RKN44965.1 MarR family transcriptional regulator [Streptomyces hoynatensis]
MPTESTNKEAMPARVRDLPTWLLGRAAAHSHRLLAAGFAEAGAHGYHYRLLAALEEFGPASQAALGRHAGIDRSDVVAALNELAGLGHIRRTPDPTDRRRNIVSITPAGLRQLSRLDGVLARVQERVLAPLPEADRGPFLAALSRLAAGQEPPGAPGAP